MPKRPLKPEEKRAWARVAKTVRPRPGKAPAQMPPLDAIDIDPDKAAKPVPKSPRASRTFHPANTAKTAPGRTPAPIPNRGRERRIRRGQANISATLDLHGHSQESAQTQLVSFLGHHRQYGARCVLVITGKGRLGEGVLRKQLLRWLGTSDARRLVSGYAEAHRKHGGSGAWYIFLRKSDV